MDTSEKTQYTLLTNRRSLQVIASLFKLTSEEIDHPNCGDWIADCIKQIQTSQLMVKAILLRQNKNTSVETYNKDPFEDKPNPLLITEFAPEKVI